jgi:hypothetical protein
VPAEGIIAFGIWQNNKSNFWTEKFKNADYLNVEKNLLMSDWNANNTK